MNNYIISESDLNFLYIVSIYLGAMFLVAIVLGILLEYIVLVYFDSVDRKAMDAMDAIVYLEYPQDYDIDR